MSLSREIIVLDFGDEATSPYDFDKPRGPPAGGNCKILKIIIIFNKTIRIFENILMSSNFEIFRFSDRFQSGRS